MTTVMNMSGYEIESNELANGEYGDEVLYAELVPRLEQLHDSDVAEVDKHSPFSGEMSRVDIDAFLQKMYRNQR